MHVLLVRCPSARKDAVIAELWERGTLGIAERDLPGAGSELEAWFSERFTYEAEEPCESHWQDAPATDWSEQWRDVWEPLTVGRRLWLLPHWRTDAAPPGKLAVRVFPRQASGSGYHAPTQLALEALEEFLEPGASVLDVGCGTGILLAAAHTLGAGACFGCDADWAALGEAAGNLAAEDIRAALWQGSPRSSASARYQLVAANLNAMTILNLAAELDRIVAPGGRLVLSGFTARGVDRIRRAFARCELAFLERAEWRCLVFGDPTGPR